VTAIKICGVTLADDAARIAAAGVEYIGLNFWPRSRRYLDPARAPLVAAVARAGRDDAPIGVVGVFVDEDPDVIAALVAAVPLDVIQLHGDETADEAAAIGRRCGRPVWKAVAIAGAPELHGLAGWPAEALVLDAPTPGRGGGGRPFDWALGAAAVARLGGAPRVVLAGGLRPDNVAAAIAQVGPWAVDVASGIEAGPGIKDPAKLAAFVAAVRGA
jgi:phosphoribosylanthranilate isomerase